MTVGFALFAMFFGAGNLIFPPDIGVRCGSRWLLGFIFFFAADAGLSILALFAMIRTDGDIKRVTGTFGKRVAGLITTVVILCVGPCLAIPRTAATTFELGVLPLAPEGSFPAYSKVIFSVVFFVIVFILSVRPGKVVDIVGRVMTPVLLAALVVMIVSGVIDPVSPPGESIVASSAQYGLNSGYQTMDSLAAMYFALIIIGSIRSKGYSRHAEVNGMAVKASVLTCVLLFLVYGGLAYLGATTGLLWREELASGAINQASLLIAITRRLLGQTGMVILGVVVLFACLTTAVGLTTAAAEYFVELSGGRVAYKLVAALIATISALICNLGLSRIISIAAPILSFVYPVIIVQIILALLPKQLIEQAAAKASVLMALAVSVINMLCDNFHISGLSWIHDSIPLDAFGVNWLVPTVCVFIVVTLISKAAAPRERVRAEARYRRGA